MKGMTNGMEEMQQTVKRKKKKNSKKQPGQISQTSIRLILNNFVSYAGLLFFGALNTLSVKNTT